MIAPTLTALFGNSSWHLGSECCPLGGSVHLDPVNNCLVLVQCPRSTHDIWVCHLLPMCENLFVRPSWETACDCGPICALLHELRQKGVFFRCPSRFSCGDRSASRSSWGEWRAIDCGSKVHDMRQFECCSFKIAAKRILGTQISISDRQRVMIMWKRCGKCIYDIII